MRTKTLLLASIMWLTSVSLVHAELILSVEMRGDSDGTNLELQAVTSAEDTECAGNVYAEAVLEVNGTFIDLDWEGGQTCAATAMTVVHNRPWSQIAAGEVYENFGNGSGSSGSACETATFKSEVFEKQCKRERTLSPGLRAQYVVCSGPGCRFEADSDTAFIWARIVHVYIDTYPDPPYKFTVQCYATSHFTIASCTSPKP